MAQKLVIGPIDKGLRTDRTAFNIDNDSFAQLTNAYQWRGRIKRKRGTTLLGRLQRLITSADKTFTNDLLDGLEATATLVPGTINIVDSASVTWTDPGQNGILLPSGTVNYVTGIVTGPTAPSSGSFAYYPGLPVMGIEDYAVTTDDFPGTIAFDTKYSYKVSTSSPFPITDITYYSNPAGGYIGYTPKPNATPFHWNGEDYQQFYTTNYQSGFWANNGVEVPFQTNGISMQFAPSTTITVVSNTSNTITLIITNCPLIEGDFVFLNEFTSVTNGAADTLNFQSGFVTSATPNTTPLATKTVVITLPNAVIATATYVPGIVQYLTNSSNPALDCMRFYDGSGWVNFCPPLSQGTFDVDDEIAAKYYVVAAKIIYPFKDRLIFFGPVIQTSSPTPVPIYLPDVAIFSQNGTPYYTASFNGNPSSPILNPASSIPILCPDKEEATASSWFEDQSGFGGYQSAFLSQIAATVSPNADALIVGFNNSSQTRFHYTGNDLDPFAFFLVNSELGSSSTFSTINMDEGVITRGPKGFIMASQTGARRIDLDILEQPFEISNTNNGTERFCSARDFVNEWIYFTYYNSSLSFNSFFPNQTLQFNYRDNSWAIFNESYTTYGTFRRFSGFVWETLTEFPWNAWDDTWESGNTSLLEPEIVGGNQQGFLIFRAQGTGEANSLYIDNIVGSVVTSPNHCLNTNDYILISGCLGASPTDFSKVNNQIFKVSPIDRNSFRLDPFVTSETYLGGGYIQRYYVPLIQTKQFPLAWSDARKIRFGAQQYLLTKTANSQITLYMYLSQDSANAWNNSPIFPDPESTNDGLIYSTILYTCPESTNLGLTPANTNLQMPTAESQQQIWHRINTSLIGDTVQLGLTLSDAQMRSYTSGGTIFNITGITQASQCVVTCNNNFPAGVLVQISSVVGMYEINDGIFFIISANSTSITLDVNTTVYDPYVSGGSVVGVSPVNQVSEIEFHGCVIDVSPSSLLS